MIPTKSLVLCSHELWPGAATSILLETLSCKSPRAQSHLLCSQGPEQNLLRPVCPWGADSHLVCLWVGHCPFWYCLWPPDQVARKGSASPPGHLPGLSSWHCDRLCFFVFSLPTLLTPGWSLCDLESCLRGDTAMFQARLQVFLGPWT